MRRSLVILVTLVSVLALPGSAMAKGPSGFTIHIPGLDAPIATIDGMDQAHSGVLTDFMHESGFMQLLWGDSARASTPRPNGDLGPVYEVRWEVMAPPPDDVVVVVQELYPYAEVGPVTYLEPGQPMWDGSRSGGGWTVGGESLSGLLVDVGLPEEPPSSASSSSISPSSTSPMTRPALLIVGVIALLLVSVAGVRSFANRRRPVSKDALTPG